MSKVIIGIHGLGNKPPKNLLEEWWKTSIIEGFEQSGIAPSPFKFEMVYWADIVYKYPENPNITDKNDTYFLEEPYQKSSKATWKIKKNYSFRKKVLQFIEKELEKVFLNKDMSLNYAEVSDAVMYKYFMELEMYYGKTNNQVKLKHETRNRLLRVIEKYKYDEILLIGHSMGSIIAYDVLQFELKNQKIHTFVTMGSPLGLPFIRAKIAQELRSANNDMKISTPDCISSAWLNLADLEDRIALNFDLSNDFSSSKSGIHITDYEIINDYEYEGTTNPHKAYGYLRSKEFILRLNSFLTEKKELSLKSIVKDIRKFGHQIKRLTD